MLRIDKKDSIQKDVPGHKVKEKRNYGEAIWLITYYAKQVGWKTKRTYV